ncbi:KCNJ2 [Acrasis kona]|uniref:KCNJ2 n=1 Tax=Acrasis kona TaxID=1008807 RepID=A0AAW2Z6R1_9EUKA
MDSLFDSLWVDDSSAIDMRVVHDQADFAHHYALPVPYYTEEVIEPPFINSECSLFNFKDMIETSPIGSNIQTFDNLIGCYDDEIVLGSYSEDEEDCKVPQTPEPPTFETSASSSQDEEEQEEIIISPRTPKRAKLSKQRRVIYDSDEPSTFDEDKRKSPKVNKIEPAQAPILEQKIIRKPKVERKKLSKRVTQSENIQVSGDSGSQVCCCIDACGNPVTNRLRFSLRTNNSFKQSFLDLKWDKVCSYHYFRDLYQHKKSLNHH